MDAPLPNPVEEKEPLVREGIEHIRQTAVRVR